MREPSRQAIHRATHSLDHHPVLLNVSQVAQLLNVSRYTVLRMVKDGRLKTTPRSPMLPSNIAFQIPTTHLLPYLKAGATK